MSQDEKGTKGLDKQDLAFEARAVDSRAEETPMLEEELVRQIDANIEAIGNTIRNTFRRNDVTERLLDASSDEYDPALVAETNDITDRYETIQSTPNNQEKLQEVKGLREDVAILARRIKAIVREKKNGNGNGDVTPSPPPVVETPAPKNPTPDLTEQANDLQADIDLLRTGIRSLEEKGIFQQVKDSQLDDETKQKVKTLKLKVGRFKGDLTKYEKTLPADRKPEDLAKLSERLDGLVNQANQLQDEIAKTIPNESDGQNESENPNPPDSDNQETESSSGEDITPEDLDRQSKEIVIEINGLLSRYPNIQRPDFSEVRKLGKQGKGVEALEKARELLARLKQEVEEKQTRPTEKKTSPASKEREEAIKFNTDMIALFALVDVFKRYIDNRRVAESMQKHITAEDLNALEAAVKSGMSSELSKIDGFLQKASSPEAIKSIKNHKEKIKNALHLIAEFREILSPTSSLNGQPVAEQSFNISTAKIGGQNIGVGKYEGKYKVLIGFVVESADPGKYSNIAGKLQRIAYVKGISRQKTAEGKNAYTLLGGLQGLPFRKPGDIYLDSLKNEG